MFLSRRRNPKSRLNLSCKNPTTTSYGALIPTNITRVVAGDDFSYQPSSYLQAMPLLAPLIGGVSIKKEYFFIPERLYNVELAMNFSGVTEAPHEVYYPSLVVDADNYINVDSEHLDEKGFAFTDLSGGDSSSVKDFVAPGSLADYLGICPGSCPIGLTLDMTPVAGYLDIIYSYYLNQQWDKIPTNLYRYLNTGVSSTDAGQYSIDWATLETFLLTLKTTRATSDSNQWSVAMGAVESEGRFGLGGWSWLCSRASIFQRAFPDYYLESWLKTSGFNASNMKVDVTSNSVSVRSISTASHLQRFRDLAFGGGSRGSDFIKAEFDVDPKLSATVPLFLGSDTCRLGSNVLYQTTGAGDASSPLGSFSGQMSGGDSFKRRTFHFNENGYFMEITSVVPTVVYPNYLNPTLLQTNLGQRYAPALDNIQMQPLTIPTLLGNVFFYTGSGDYSHVLNHVGAAELRTVAVGKVSFYEDVAVGYQPAWAELMTSVSKPHGRLCNDLDYWAFQRRYGTSIYNSRDASDASLFLEELGQSVDTLDVETFNAWLKNTYVSTDFVPYILPAMYNYVFADTDPNAQNFVLDNSAEISVYREKSKVNVPDTI